MLLVAILVIGSWSLRYLGRYRPFADLLAGGPNLGGFGLVIKEAVVVGHNGGLKRWRIGAHLLTLSQDRRSVTADGLHDGILYDEHQKPVVTVSADRATYTASVGSLDQTTNGTLDMTGHITGTLLRRGGITLRTEHLTWDSVGGFIQSLSPVALTLPGGAGSAQADTVRADVRTGNLDIGHIHGTFRIAPNVLKSIGLP